MVNFLFLLSIICTIISFAFPQPTLREILQISAQALIGSLFLLSILKFLHRHISNVPLIIRNWFYCLIALLVFLIFMPEYAKDSYWNGIREFFIPFAITFSAFILLDFSDKQFRIGVMAVAVFSIMATMYALINTGGFAIEAIYREILSKNQTAPFFSIVGLICFYQSLKERRSIVKVILLAAFVCCLTYCIVLRARTSTLGILIITLFVFWKYYKRKALIYLPIIICVAICFFSEDISLLYEESFVGNANASDLDSLSSGRYERNIDSFNFFLNHPFIGAVEGDPLSMFIWGDYPMPHFYLLWKCVQFGIIFSIPFFIIYIKLGINVIKWCFSDNESLFLAGICLLMAMLTSLAEYSAPFGPGTSFILCYMLFGKTLRSIVSEKKSVYNLSSPPKISL